MKWYAKLIIAFSLLVLLAVILGMVYVVGAKNALNEYILRNGNAFNAAMLINGEETFTDPERAVIAEYEGTRAVVVPENYRALTYYLKENAARPIFARLRREGALTLTVCGGTVFTVAFDEDGETATCELAGGGRPLLMRLRGIALRDRLLSTALEGTTAAKNLPAE